jgi:hypothetical protein
VGYTIDNNGDFFAATERLERIADELTKANRSDAERTRREVIVC